MFIICSYNYKALLDNNILLARLCLFHFHSNLCLIHEFSVPQWTGPRQHWRDPEQYSCPRKGIKGCGN